MVLSDRTIKEELDSSKYQGQTVPTASRFSQDFTRKKPDQAS